MGLLTTSPGNLSPSDRARWHGATEGARHGDGSDETAKPTLSALDWVFGGLAALGAIATAFCVMVSTTIHYIDAMAVVAVAIVPVELLATTFVLRDHPLSLRRLAVRLTDGPARSRIKAAATLLLLLVGVPTSAILYANRALDRSPGVAQSLPVTELFIEHSRRGVTRYMAGVMSEGHLPPRLIQRLVPIDDNQRINVGPSLYARLSLGDRLIVTVHSGLFGFVWYERGVRKAQ